MAVHVPSGRGPAFIIRAPFPIPSLPPFLCQVVKEMEAQQLRSARWWRVAFGVLAVAIGSLYLYLAVRQVGEREGEEGRRLPP